MKAATEELLTITELAKSFNINRDSLRGFLHDKFILRLNKAHPRSVREGWMIIKKGCSKYTLAGVVEVERILREAGKIK